MGGLSQHGKHLYKLNRHKKERWHLLRTMVTQLVEHERISTTKQKCKAVRSLAERVLVLSKRVSEKNDENARRELQSILTTQLARKKAVMEIAPRFKDKHNSFTRIKAMDKKRLGDAAPMAYIEYIGNDIERYEATAKEENIQKGLEVDQAEWEYQVMKQERDFFLSKIEECEEQLKVKQVEDEALLAKGQITQQQFDQRQIVNSGQLEFFQTKLRQVDHDIFIANKNPFDKIKFPASNFVAGGYTSNLQVPIEQLENKQ